MNFFDSVFADQDTQRRERTVRGISMAKVTSRMADGTYELQFLGMGGTAPSAPARMMMPGAGNKRGMYMMPEVGDEVVVAFEAGDSNSPVILGGLFNNQSPTPDQANPSNANNVRTIVSRSGHEVTMDDSPGAGKVTVKTSGGRSLTLDDTGLVTLGTPSGISIKLDDTTSSLIISAPLAITLQSAAVNIEGAVVKITAGAITLNTSGMMPTSTVIIDGKPFGMHVHGTVTPPTPPTPPVLP
jgi:phage baseplate assembly protein gpV